MSSRWLRLNGTQIAIEGESRKKLEEKIKAMVDEALVEARGRETQNDFKGALDSYQRALGLDSTNWTARNGAESMRQKLATLEEAKRQELEAERKRREELYNRGESLYEQKRFRDSMPLFQKACDSGDMAGCARLGQLYDYGNGVPKDHARAIPLYQKACDAGVMSGCGELSGNYSLGTGVNPDYIKARALAQRACNSGNALGCNNLAWLYLNGRGVTRDLAQARFFYQKACNGGFDLACASLRTVH
jgi:TPR repeat protein